MKIINSTQKMKGVGDLISFIATPIARSLNMSCIDPETKQLRPTSSCAQRRDNLNQLVPFKLNKLNP
jgi:hypothetical protein